MRFGESHKSNIRKAKSVLNPEEPYYVDEAFSDMIFVWDTLLMMMFDKYGIHQFPTLQAMDNFYYCQVDNPGQPDDGFIAREISEITGENADYNGGYDDPHSVNPPSSHGQSGNNTKCTVTNRALPRKSTERPSWSALSPILILSSAPA